MEHEEPPYCVVGPAPASTGGGGGTGSARSACSSNAGATTGTAIATAPVAGPAPGAPPGTNVLRALLALSGAVNYVYAILRQLSPTLDNNNTLAQTARRKTLTTANKQIKTHKNQQPVISEQRARDQPGIANHSGVQEY